MGDLLARMATRQSPPALDAHPPHAIRPSADQAQVGRQICELRRSRKISLVEMSVLTGRSIGNLSEIERGLSPITTTLLQNIAEALGVSLTWFFGGSAAGPARERDVIVRKANRRRLDFAGAGLSEELVSPTLDSRFMLVETTFAPGSSTDAKPRARKAEEGGVVLAGRLELTFRGEVHLLEAGDSFSLKGEDPHFCRNPGKTDAVVLWIISPPRY